MTLTNPAKRFDYFVLLAEMRTGSNFLEANLNEMPGVRCHGEAFNAHFIAHKGQEHYLDITLPMREADPMLLVHRMQERTDGLAGFRYFHDHDARVLAQILPDPRCAKIILTRNPLESYLSLKIAQQTGQWMLKDVKNQKSAKVRFEVAEFEAHVAELQAFQVRLLNGLQTTGQTAFYIAYEDIGDVAVLNGLAEFLGVGAVLEAPSKSLKKQNPEDIADKVVNPEAMAGALATLDRFNLARTPNFEPRRGAMVPGFIAAATAPLLYMPIRATGEARIAAWLAAQDSGALQERFNHKTLRQWKKQHPGHRSFTLIRHPLARAHVAFCDYILSGALPEVWSTLRKTYKVPLLDVKKGKTYTLRDHRAAFLGFLKVLKGNLAGQTSLRIDASWASQCAVIQGFSGVVQPDLVLREDRLAEGLAYLAAQIGLPCPGLPPETARPPFALADFYDDEIEAAAQDAYQRDYISFGFAPWTP